MNNKTKTQHLSEEVEVLDKDEENKVLNGRLGNQGTRISKSEYDPVSEPNKYPEQKEEGDQSPGDNLRLRMYGIRTSNVCFWMRVRMLW